MDKDFAEVIRRMASEQGKETLVNGKAKIYLSDYCAGQFKKEAKTFRQILDAGCGEHINNADNVPERKLKLMEQLEEENDLSPKATAEYLDLLGLILKGDTSKCGEAAPPAPPPTQTQPPIPPQTTPAYPNHLNSMIAQVAARQAAAKIRGASASEPTSAPYAGIGVPILAPVQGIVTSHTVKEGAQVVSGDIVAILEYMKYEMGLFTTDSGKVHFLVSAGSQVISQTPIAEIL